MDQDLKKKLTRNWFVNLQEMICEEIKQIEGEKNKNTAESADSNLEFLRKKSVKKLCS